MKCMDTLSFYNGLHLKLLFVDNYDYGPYINWNGTVYFNVQ